MKSIAFAPRTGTCFLAVLLCAATAALAQQPVPGQQQRMTAALEIKSMPKPGKINMITPDVNFRTGTPSSVSRKAREWGVIDVTYKTASATKWVDTVDFAFHVLAEGKNAEGKKEFSFYTMNVRYLNVPDGEHRAGVVLHPSALERFGHVVAIAVDATIEGGLPVEKSESISSDVNKVQGNWWKSPQILDSPLVKKRDGLLIERSKSPFAMVNPDDYEMVR